MAPVSAELDEVSLAQYDAVWSVSSRLWKSLLQSPSLSSAVAGKEVALRAERQGEDSGNNPRRTALARVGS